MRGVSDRAADAERSPLLKEGDGPAKRRVCVVGAGWTGLVVAAALTAETSRRVQYEVVIVEKLDDVGGTWHADSAYESMHIHAPAWTMELAAFPFKEYAGSEYKGAGQAELNAWSKPTAGEVQRYLRAFADKLEQEYGVVFYFSANVTGVEFDSARRTADVTFTQATGSSTASGSSTAATRTLPGFDFVLATAYASIPRVPAVARAARDATLQLNTGADLRNTRDSASSSGDDSGTTDHRQAAGGFRGELYHTADVTEDVFDRAKQFLARGKRVVVVGGGQSAVERLSRFADEVSAADLHNLRWLYREPYAFMFYENLLFTSPLHYLRNFCLMVFLLVFAVLPRVAMWGLYMCGVVDAPVGFTTDPRRFHLGIITHQQRVQARRIGSVRGYVAGVDEGGLRLSNGETVNADMVIFATGYSTGNTSLRLRVDGEDKSLDDAARPGLIKHLVLPDVPIGFSCNPQYHFGPNRGVTIADEIDQYLNTRPTLKQASDRIWWQTTKFNPAESAIFLSEHSYVQAFARSLLDLWLARSVSLFSILTVFLMFFIGHKNIPIQGQAQPRGVGWLLADLVALFILLAPLLTAFTISFVVSLPFKRF